MHAIEPVSIPCEVITFTLLNLYDGAGNKGVNHTHNPYRYNIQGITQRGKDKFKYRLHKVAEVTGYGLDDRGVGVRVPVGSRIFSSPGRPDWRWGPPSLLSKEFFPRG
jgi:hypothetical protein